MVKVFLNLGSKLRHPLNFPPMKPKTRQSLFLPTLLICGSCVQAQPKSKDITKLPGELTSQYDYRWNTATESLENIIDGKPSTKYHTTQE
jgi:hypothetical protein